MRRFANCSWRTVGLLAAAWVLAWLTADAVGIWLSFRELNSGSQLSGGVAAIGFGATVGGAITIVGPPLMLLGLRLLAGRLTAR
jgi:hypothetical protein